MLMASRFPSRWGDQRLNQSPCAYYVDIRNQPGVRTDFRGYTVVSNLSVYRKTISPSTRNDAGRCRAGDQHPHGDADAGAVVSRLSAEVRSPGADDLDRQRPRRSVWGGGHPVGDESGSFIVGDRGQVYLTGMREQGTLVATWGSQSSQQCRADFKLPNHSTYGGIADMRATCRQER